MKSKNWESKIYAYALKNAIEYKGKAMQGAVISSLFHEGLKKEEVKKITPIVGKIIQDINKLKLEEQEQKFEELEKLTSERKIRVGLPSLPKAKKGKVVLRFAPYPSGPLHIGNARTAVLNDKYAEMYKGKMILVIDDTIGSKEKEIAKEAYKLIPESLDWMKIKYNKPIIYKSDRLEIYYEYAEKLIKKDKAYVCNCSQEKIRENRVKMRECSCRQFPIDEQLKRWKAMFSKEVKPGDLTLRIKTSMQDQNPAFRDRVLFRISDKEHPRVKKKYRVWPMLDFSWAIDDHLLKVTHIIRGKDLMIETDMENYIWEIFKWKKPIVIHNGLLHIKGVKISKSKGQKEIKQGKYAGWDDPRTWSLQSLEKRGFQPQAIKQFLIEFGIKDTEVEVSLEILDSKNREIVHEIAEKIQFENADKGNAIILMPDGSWVYGKVDGKLEAGKIYHLLKFGYCRLNKKGKVNEFWFSHP